MGETILVRHTKHLVQNSFDQPVFILNYPKAIKPFYMKPHPTRDDVVICADMIAPEGYKGRSSVAQNGLQIMNSC